jgi:hypothetical protein
MQIRPQEALLPVTKRLQQLRRSFESAHAATGRLQLVTRFIACSSSPIGALLFKTED